MWRRVARRVLERLDRLLEPGEDVRLADAAGCRRSCPAGRRSPPSGCVCTTQWACSLNDTTPSSSRSVIAAAARRIASLPMSTLRTPPMPVPPPIPPSNVLQWQASIEPDWSMTTTSATSGCFWRSRTPMSTGSVSSSGVFW